MCLADKTWAVTNDQETELPRKEDLHGVRVSPGVDGSRCAGRGSACPALLTHSFPLCEWGFTP